GGIENIVPVVVVDDQAKLAYAELLVVEAELAGGFPGKARVGLEIGIAGAHIPVAVAEPGQKLLHQEGALQLVAAPMIERPVVVQVYLAMRQRAQIAKPVGAPGM